jgi:hypothetical protein
VKAIGKRKRKKEIEDEKGDVFYDKQNLFGK